MEYIAYYRVSRPRQGISGLGLESQKQIVSAYLHGTPLLAEFTEVESGKSTTRKELAKALALVKERNATLVIAKLDRLARNVSFLCYLLDSKVKFVACDMPDANEMTIHIIAAVAQGEHKMITDRITNALQVAKQRGVKLGNPLLKDPVTAKKQAKAAQSHREYKKPDKAVIELLNQYNNLGLSIRLIAAKLSEVFDKKYSTTFVYKNLKKYASKAQ